MEKRPSSYQLLLLEARNEYEEWLKSIQRKECVKYCIKCRTRIVLDGLSVCKHCYGSDVTLIKPRMRRKLRTTPKQKKTKTSIKRNRSLKSELKG